MESQPLVPIPYHVESSLVWARIFRLLGGLSIIFGITEILLTLTDPIQTLYIAFHAEGAADFSLREYFIQNWLLWLQAVAVLFVAIGGFWCLLHPTRTRLLIIASSVVILINLFYLGLICMAIWRAVRSGQFEPDWAFAVPKIGLQKIVDIIFPAAVILIARAGRRQVRTQT